MVYQIAVTTTETGYGFCRYTTNEDTANKIKQSYLRKLPDCAVLVREIEYPTQDQIFQADDVDTNWGIK